jgi:tRNA pseudouridine38-40 synthase
MDWLHPIANLQKAVNSYLPSDIALQAICSTDDAFHPRFSAQSRTYRYKIVIAPARDPLRSRFMWQRKHLLAVDEMTEAAQMLIGTHNFATFGQPPQGTNTIRHVMRSDIRAIGDEIWFTITANAFLQRMVRSIVGTLVEVGRGKLSVEAFNSAFSATDRAKSGPSAPAQGLTLINVAYENPDVQKKLSLFNESGLSEFAERPEWQ